MCHALLQDPKLFRLLLRIDEELAAEVHAGRCECGGVLHRANYPRKPRGCLNEVRSEFEFRFSLCCAACWKQLFAANPLRSPCMVFGRRQERRAATGYGAQPKHGPAAGAGIKKVKAVAYLYALARNLMRMISLVPEWLGIGTDTPEIRPVAA